LPRIGYQAERSVAAPHGIHAPFGARNSGSFLGSVFAIGRASTLPALQLSNGAWQRTPPFSRASVQAYPALPKVIPGGRLSTKNDVQKLLLRALAGKCWGQAEREVKLKAGSKAGEVRRLARL